MVALNSFMLDYLNLFWNAKGITMRTRIGGATIIMGVVISLTTLFSTHVQPIRFDFSDNSVKTSFITIQGAGFGAYHQAKIFFSFVPLDNAFDGATDGKGAIIQAKPEEGIMIFFPIITTNRAVMIRCSVRTTSKEASVYLASIDQGTNQFVSTITPNNGSFFLNRWKRITGFCIPPSTGFRPDFSTGFMWDVQGRKKQDVYNLYSLPSKEIWLYPLTKNFKQIFCAP